MQSKATTGAISVLVTPFLAVAAWLVWQRQMPPAAPAGPVPATAEAPGR